MQRFNNWEKLAEELKALNGELGSFKYTIPNLGEPTMMMMRPETPLVLQDGEPTRAVCYRT
jgi:hypothetical protein